MNILEKYLSSLNEQSDLCISKCHALFSGDDFYEVQYKKCLNKCKKIRREQNETQTTHGYLNFMEDRYVITNKWKASMQKCFAGSVNTPQLRIKMYECQINACETALQNIEQGKQKCDSVKYPDKCQSMYDRLEEPLRKKIMWNKNEINRVRRKANLVSFDDE